MKFCTIITLLTLIISCTKSRQETDIIYSIYQKEKGIIDSSIYKFTYTMLKDSAYNVAVRKSTGALNSNAVIKIDKSAISMKGWNDEYYPVFSFVQYDTMLRCRTSNDTNLLPPPPVSFQESFCDLVNMNVVLKRKNTIAVNNKPYTLYAYEVSGCFVGDMKAYYLKDFGFVSFTLDSKRALNVSSFTGTNFTSGEIALVMEKLKSDTSFYKYSRDIMY